VSSAEIGAGSEFALAGGGTFAIGAEEAGHSAQIQVTEEPDWQRAELVRRLACRLEDGAVLLLGAVRPAGAEGHGDEVVTTQLLGADGQPAEIAEGRLTTEYDEAGAPRRIGLELVLADEAEPPLRGAATLDGSGAWELKLDGTAGVAAYELVRPG
jgi:hypothetical protein